MKLPHLFLAACLPFAGHTVACAASAAATRPNVLFIAIDDFRPALGVYGDTLAITPHLDQLAGTSRVFLRAYTQQAVCGPSRASLLTGRLPDNTGVWHNRNHFRTLHPDLVTLPQLFKNHGYQSLSMGKIFSGNPLEEDPPSWSEPAVLNRPDWRNYVLHRGDGKGPAYEAADVPDNAYKEGKLTDLAVSTLQNLKANNTPFFLAVGFFKPHLPFNAPKRYWDMYDPTVFELGPQPARVEGAPADAYRPHRELGGYSDVPRNERVTPEQARILRHGYYACVSFVDAQIGRLLATLRDLGLEDNTIVVLWGDHGFALGEVGRWAKGTNFELDARVPLMIRSPHLAKPGVPTEAMVELVDLYPTIASLAGLPLPRALDGRSLQPILDDPAATGRPWVLSQFSRPDKPDAPVTMGYSIRTTTHRYTRWINWADKRTVAEELYDYTDQASVQRMDTYVVEHTNLAATSKAGLPALETLRAAMDQTLQTRSTAFANPPAAASPSKKKGGATARPAP
jgi:iduronate 2-sulfatase